MIDAFTGRRKTEPLKLRRARCATQKHKVEKKKTGCQRSNPACNIPPEAEHTHTHTHTHTHSHTHSPALSLSHMCVWAAGVSKPI